jgi:hypothetical protein
LITFFLPAIQTRGGILVAWQSSAWSVLNTSARQFSVSAMVHHVSRDQEWWLSSVYGPAKDCDRPAFLDELNALRQVRLGLWVICGDFNMIYQAQDKIKSQHAKFPFSILKVDMMKTYDRSQGADKVTNM